MSTRSLIAKEMRDGRYLTIYCHHEGCIQHNGAILHKFYNTEAGVDALLALGDISQLGKNIDYDHRPVFIEGTEFPPDTTNATVAYGRDRDEENTEARKYTMEELVTYPCVSYIYIYTRQKEWTVLMPKAEGFEKPVSLKGEIDKEDRDYRKRLKWFNEAVKKCERRKEAQK